ncbi:hypothetical protein [Onishia taeanensis]|uniref:hypothetical protein n=1 Tax=Onishia taeanensis TaxID=284577 RepID=UPI0011143F1C|nr:hypothetical protein [Halomonas taeanensis]
MADHTEPRITFHSHFLRVRNLAGDSLITDSRNAIELCERGYPHRPELSKKLPRENVGLGLLSTQSGHAGKGSKRDYWCYIATPTKMHKKSMG